uniref:Uncharacterized protein n=1 Tax=Leersia perrieri TaxID=77586 RepID=A0A0D9V229_9ORYZ
MVFYGLYYWAELDNLTDLRPRGGCDDPTYPYYFKLRCGNCGEVSAKATCVSLGEVVELGRSTVNLVQKCKLCGREASIVMIPGQGTPLTIEQSQHGDRILLMVFDCRGCEPIDFAFGDGWRAESLDGTTFDIDCSEGEFADYDEKGEYPVGLGKLRPEFRVVKKQERHGKTKYV